MNEYWQAIYWFVETLNRLRQNYNQPQLSLTGKACDDCQKHNEWMSKIHDLQHSPFPGYSENIAYLGFKPSIEQSAIQVMRLWLNCNEHRTIMFSPSARYVGLAFYYSDDGVYATMRVF